MSSSQDGIGFKWNRRVRDGDDDTFDESPSFSIVPTDEELSERIATLLQRYSCAPTPQGWMELAIKLAVQHREPGFGLDFSSLPKRNRKADEQAARDAQIEAYQTGRAFERKTIEGRESCEPIASVTTAKEASERVAALLLRKWEDDGRRGSPPPTATSLESQYSARRNVGARRLPIYMLVHMAASAACTKLLRIAGNMTDPAPSIASKSRKPRGYKTL